MSRSAGATEGARAAALRILQRVEGGAWASVLLDRVESSLVDRREAALLHETVLGVIRHRSALDHALAQVASRSIDAMDGDVRCALRIGAHALLLLDRVPGFAAVSTAVELVRGSSRRAFVNAVLRQVARRGRSLLPPRPEPGDVAGLAIHASFPRWWIERLVARSGWEATVALAEASNRPAPTVLHAAGGADGRQRLIRRIAELELETEPGRVFADAFRIRSGSPASLVQEGLAWVQDEAARLVPRLLGRPYGPRVADLCAAPGGKTLEIADGLRENGRVVAVDRNANRARRITATAARLAAGKVWTVCADAGRGSALRPGFDQVLLDAPCSGTGTLRRHPEIKWRLRHEDPKLLALQQRELLAAAAELARTGGCVVYSVCSLEPEEGEDVVNDFLSLRRDFTLADPRPLLPAPALALVRSPGYVVTGPAQGELDGFFAARLVRSSA